MLLFVVLVVVGGGWLFIRVGLDFIGISYSNRFSCFDSVVGRIL